jgi:hypothetical protein
MLSDVRNTIYPLQFFSNDHSGEEWSAEACQIHVVDPRISQGNLSIAFHPDHNSAATCSYFKLCRGLKKEDLTRYLIQYNGGTLKFRRFTD